MCFREITFEELNQILNFVVTVKDENMVRMTLVLRVCRVQNVCVSFVV